MMKNKYILSVIAVTMGMLFFGAGIATAEKYGDLTYTVSEDEIIITECEKSATEIVIPNEINGVKVTKIGDSAFLGCENAVGVTIPESITNIGIWAFSDCEGLKAVYITDMEAWCSINFGNYYSNPLFFAENLYLNNEPVENLKIPDSITEIKNYAFLYCDSFKSVTIPETVKSIGNYAFYHCEGITDVSLPESITYVGSFAFADCYNLKSVDINATIKSIGTGIFSCCESLEKIIIPEGITEIGESAFSNCVALKDITIPSSIEYIGTEAFWDCTGVSHIYYSASEEEWDAIVIEEGNDCITNKKIITFNTVTEKTIYTKTSLCAKTPKYDIYFITPVNIPLNSTIIFACFADNKITYLETRTYTGESSVYFVKQGVDDYNTVKVMVWDKLSTLKPLSSVEIIK